MLQSFADKRGRLVAQRGQTESERGRQSVWATWSDDNPKVALTERKRAAIVAAARQAFLENGYAQTSMDRIAELATVSVKTIYRHFENKDELFSAVMQATCLKRWRVPHLSNSRTLSRRDSNQNCSLGTKANGLSVAAELVETSLGVTKKADAFQV